MLLRTLLIAAVLFVYPYTVFAKPGNSERVSISLSIQADEAISASVNDCFRRAIRQSGRYILASQNPDVSLSVIARQSPKSNEKLILSVNIQETFDNKAMVKHWASGFRQSLPYAAQTSLLQATNALFRKSSHSLYIVDRQDIDNTCKNLLAGTAGNPG